MRPDVYFDRQNFHGAVSERLVAANVNTAPSNFMCPGFFLGTLVIISGIRVWINPFIAIGVFRCYNKLI